MKKFILFTCASALIGLFSVSCSHDNTLENCQRDAHALITEVDQNAQSVIVRQDLPMQIKFQLDNSCGKLKNLEVVKNGFQWEVKAIARYEGCECSEVTETATESFVFRVAETGVYTIKFVNPNGESIVQTVNVTQN